MCGVWWVHYRLSTQVEQLLDSQSKLLQQLHQVQTQLEHQQEAPLQPQQPGILQLSNYQAVQYTSPIKMQQLSSPSRGGSIDRRGLQNAKQHVRSSIDSQLDLQLQQLQEQIEDLSREQQPAQHSPGVQVAGHVAATAAQSAYSNTSMYGSAGWLSAAGAPKQLEMMADQAETIQELKRVIEGTESCPTRSLNAACQKLSAYQT